MLVYSPSVASSMVLKSPLDFVSTASPTDRAAFLTLLPAAVTSASSAALLRTSLMPDCRASGVVLPVAVFHRRAAPDFTAEPTLPASGGTTSAATLATDPA